MKAKTRTTANLVVVSLIISSAWADQTPPNVASNPMSPAPVNAGIPNCTTEERMKEIAKENSFAQNRLEEAKDIGANVLGAALGMLAGVDVPVGEAREAYTHAKGAKQTYEIFTACTPEQEADIKKINEQAAARVRGGEDKNPDTAPTSPEAEEITAERTGKFLRTLPF